MIVNGIDLSALPAQEPSFKFPDVVKGRTAHIDADFLAYMVSYEKKGTVIELKDMQHNAQMAVERMRKAAGAERVHLHLTPGTSDKGGRYDAAIQKEYQANRKDEKPDKLHIMREWMGRHFPATLHQLCEADDGMSSEQWAMWNVGTPELSVIISKDKDLRMVPGFHLPWDGYELCGATIDPFGYIELDAKPSSTKVVGYGTKFFWAQMLMGDQADNIQGLPVLCRPDLSKPKKVGPVLAYNLLSDLKSDKEAFQYVRGLYEATGREVGFKHWRTGETVTWQNVLISEMKLLWMRRDKHVKDDVLNWLKEVCK